MPSDHRHFKTLATRVIHSGAPRPRIEGAVVTPLFQSANYLMAGETEYGAVRYVRLGNSPSHEVLQHRLAAVEEAEAGDRLHGDRSDRPGQLGGSSAAQNTPRSGGIHLQPADGGRGPGGAGEVRPQP